MNRDPRSFIGLAKIFYVIALLVPTIHGLAQQPLQVLRNHVRSAVSSRQAAVVSSLPPTERLSLSIILPLRNQTELAGLLNRLYDPSSTDYRQFLTVEQFTDRFAPTAEDYRAVVDFAQANGFTVTETPPNRLFVGVDASAAQIDKAFHVLMNVYQHPTEGRTFFSPDREPALDLAVPVAHIAGLNNYSIPRPTVQRSPNGRAFPNASGSGPGGSYLPKDMRAAYYGGTGLDGSGQVVGLFEFLGYNISDVTSSFDGAATSTTLAPCATGFSSNGGQFILHYTTGGSTYNVAINNVKVGISATCAGSDDAEQVLDIAQVIGMAPGLSQVRVYMATGYPMPGAEVGIFNKMATENEAKVLSCSWTWEPDDPSENDYIFQEFAAQGQSLFVSSGDDGAYPNSTGWYYPAEDDYVTSVGGTDLTTDGAGGAWVSESAWVDSGGGISPDGLSIPSWQEGVANSSNKGSTTLRNVPDIAMEADYDNYVCDVGTCSGNWGGTSFAAPRWAGFIALVNQQAVAAGKSTVGFINSLIYPIGKGANYGSDFHDITSGNNDCCAQSVWYSAASGYDLVTGWGSPNGPNMINALAEH